MFKTFFDIKIINVSILFCFMETLSYGINVDDVISQYEKNSYTTKINEVNMKTYDIKDKALKNGDWNEIKVTSDSNYTLHGDSDGLTMENNVKYGMLYYKNGYNFRNKKVTENKIGVSKELNDYFGYSDNKYNKSTNDISRNIQKINNETTKNSEIRDLIDLYKDYKNKEKEIEQEKLTLEDSKRDYAIQSEKWNLGTTTLYDFELAKTEYENSQLKCENLERELKILGEKFMIYNVKLPEKSELEDLKKVELKKEDFYDLRLSEAESIELNSKLNDEKLRKESIDYKYPKLTADVGYSLKNHSVVFGLGVTKTFKRYNDTIEDLKNEKEKLELQYAQKKNELLSNVGQQMITYTTYETNEITAENTMNITKRNSEIYAKKYELGVDTFENYVEKRNEYRKAVKDYEKAKNELAAFTKKIKYYK
ncbi:TolC family protein [Leptotrichia sp. oral taxon 847]|uniref:TolC family protein n=1 Tax=Leptotrichia sp. oral taxon 847 TaxID=1785996 RepID=UPI0007682985|nr:TolC family protein [Leptotrichia sp. oral taxon 847]AMD95831.1 amino acid oxidase [Leptotrichia sp. oral taxon 847]